MKRVSVSFEEATMTELREIASTNGTSVAEVIRDLLSRYLVELLPEPLATPDPASDESLGETSRSLPRGRARSSALASGRVLASG
jgi:hypothetical protein